MIDERDDDSDMDRDDSSSILAGLRDTLETQMDVELVDISPEERMETGGEPSKSGDLPDTKGGDM